MANFNYYLKDSRSFKETPLFIRFVERGVNLKVYTRLKISPKHWDATEQRAKKSLPGYSEFNTRLTNHLAEVETCYNNTVNNKETLTPEELKEKFYKAIGNDTIKGAPIFKTVAEFVTSYLKEVENSKKKITIINQRQTLRLLNEFEIYTRKKLTFERVTLDFYNDFTEFLTKQKNYAPNSIGKHIRNFKLFLNEATERGINEKLDYKSKRFKALSEKAETIYLNEEELRKIYEFNFSKDQRLERVRDLFLIGCWTGLRFSDFSQLKPEHITHDEIKIRTQKTDEIVAIPIHWTVKEILNKYSESAKGLPPSISNQKMNDYLKEIGQAVGIDENILLTQTKGGLRVHSNLPKYNLITTHTARRSFATNLYLSGFPAISIMKITGHRTEKAFLSYIRISPEQNAKLLREHWNKNSKLRAV